MNVNYNSTSQLLWSYFKAPSNLLFISTNLLGLGIITTYRGLYTLANTDISDVKIPMILNDDKINWEEHSNEITRWSNKLQENVDTITDSELNEYFPVTADDLLEIENDETQDLPKDRVSMLISNQLSELENFYKTLDKSLRRKVPEVDESYKFVNSIVEITKDERYKIYLKNNNLYDYYRSNNSIRNKIFSKVNKNITLKYMEENKYTKDKVIDEVEFNEKYKKIVRKYKKVETLQYKFLKEMSNLFKQYNDVDYLMIYKDLNKYKNDNFKVFLNILSLSIFKQSERFLRTEELFKEIMLNSIHSGNKLIFEKCLINLKLSNKRNLKKMHNDNKSSKIIQQLTKGKFVNELTYSVETYLIAMRGLQQFNYQNSILIKAAKKLVSSIKTVDGEVRISCLLVKNEQAITPINEIPISIIDMIYKIGLKTKDQSILIWSIIAISKSNLVDKTKIKKFINLEKVIDDKKVKKLLSNLIYKYMN